MPFLDKTGLAHLWEQIIARLNTKIDIEAGKGLSTNDYTNEDKEKLASLDVNMLVKTVNNIEPDTNGNVALVASDVGATTEEYVNNAVAKKSQVQIITWEADD